MPQALVVIMDPIEQVKAYKDTTLLLLLAAQKRGWQLYYAEQKHLYIREGQAMGQLRPLKVYDNSDHWFELGALTHRPLAELDAALMRKDPPFDPQYIYTTYILELAEQQGTLVVNKPQSLRDCNEKVFATHFPQCCPQNIISRSIEQLKQFHKEVGQAVFKPLDGMGGSQIFRCTENDPNTSVILEVLTRDESEFIMGQRYLPDISAGDKRILVVNGTAVPYSLARIPAEGETRGNIAAGGTGRAQELSERDHWIVEQVAPTLVEKGLFFVGLDVIGDYLTEINVTSPTCAREIDKAYNTDIGTMLMEAIESELSQL